MTAMLKTFTHRAAASAAAQHCLMHASVWGFVGAQDRHLLKYAEALHAGAIPTVYRRTAPTWACFLSRAALRAEAERWLLTLQRDVPGQPGAVLLLSNGGAFVYAEAVRLLRADAALPPAAQRFPGVAFSAVVYDSAPAWVTPQSGAMALSLALGLSSHTTLLQCIKALFALTSRAWDNTLFFGTLAQDVAGTGRAPPAALLLGSTDDAVTDWGRVVQLSQAVAQHGRAAHLWQVPSPSPHCMHLMRDKAEYVARLAAFFAAAAPPAPSSAAAAAGPLAAAVPLAAANGAH